MLVLSLALVQKYGSANSIRWALSTFAAFQCSRLFLGTLRNSVSKQYFTYAIILPFIFRIPTFFTNKKQSIFRISFTFFNHILIFFKKAVILYISPISKSLSPRCRLKVICTCNILCVYSKIYISVNCCLASSSFLFHNFVSADEFFAAWKQMP